MNATDTHTGLIGRMSIQLQETATEREVQLRLHRPRSSQTGIDLGPTLVVSANNPGFSVIVPTLLAAALEQRAVEVATTGDNPPQVQRVSIGNVSVKRSEKDAR